MLLFFTFIILFDSVILRLLKLLILLGFVVFSVNFTIFRVDIF